MKWRWDQGRLEYFRFDNIVKIAHVLRALDGVPLNTSTDFLRQPLKNETGLPFSPSHYKVWRNYARTFACSMLATNVDGRMFVTDLCRKLAASPLELTSDQYFNFVFSHFTLPFPAFDDYNANLTITFPFVAIAKFVLSRSPYDVSLGITLEDVFTYVIGNSCTGVEDLGFYSQLKPTDRRPLGDEQRQVREMLVFMGQSSYLKWFDKKLYVDSKDTASILKVLVPVVRNERKRNAAEEFMALTETGSARDRRRLDIALSDRDVPSIGFGEGKRMFGTHGKLERSPLVRRHFFHAHPKLVCDACGMDVKYRYPWTENILELHHVLPLCATISVNGTTTLLEDMVPLCPSCHRSVHIYYRQKLAEWGIEDFGSKKMAHDVYNLAKMEIVV